MAPTSKRVIATCLAVLSVGCGVFILSREETDQATGSPFVSSGANPSPTEPNARQPQPTGVPRIMSGTEPTSAPQAAVTSGALTVSPLDQVLTRATLLSEASDSTSIGQIRRTRIWGTDGSIPFIRTEEILTVDDQGNGTVASRVAMVADHVLVQLTSPVVDDGTLHDLETAGIQLFESVTEGGLFRARIVRHEAPDRIPSVERWSTANQSIVQFIEPDYLVFASAIPSDPRFHEQWGLATVNGAGDIEAPAAWDIRTDASAVVVAVIDSGINASHEDLRDSLWVNPGEIPANALDDDGNGLIDDVHGVSFLGAAGDPADESGHGTHVAGIVGAAGNNGKGVTGVGWTSRIMAVKFLDRDGIGSHSNAVMAIDYAVSEGASIINASWGSEARSEALQAAIRRAGDSGVVFVAAAGNEGWDIDTRPVYPAGFVLPNLLSVAALDRDGRLAPFSNWGARTVTIAAPGVSILSTGSADDFAYRTESGSSAAAPFVSGTLALLMAHEPGLDIEGLRNRLARNSRPNAFLQGKVSLQANLDAGATLADSRQGEPHDAFADPAVITGYNFSQIVYPGLSTSETGEPLHGSSTDQGSLWFKWTSPVPAQVELNLLTDLPGAAVAVYSGETVSALTRVSGDSAGNPTRFLAQAGTAYRLAISTATDPRPLRAVLNLTAHPVNDAFSQAESITGGAFDLAGSSENASRESLEPLSDGQGRTVWWKWQPEKTELFVIATGGSDEFTRFSLFRQTGSGLGGLVSVQPAGRSEFGRRAQAFEITSGSVYFLQVDSRAINGSPFTLSGRSSRSPFIATHPQDVEIRAFQTLKLEVAALGTAPLAYQWQFGGTELAGGTRSELTIPNVTSDQAGLYRVRVTSPTGESISRSATVEVLPPELRIVYQPRNVTAKAGNRAGFAVLAISDLPITYQWYKDGEALQGEVAANFTIAAVAESDVGAYQAEATTSFGSIQSNAAHLQLKPNGSSDWQWRLPETPGMDYNASAWADGLFVLGSQGGGIAISTDGVLWQFLSLPESLDIHHVVWLNGKWVFAAVNRFEGVAYAYVTEDFETWSKSAAIGDDWADLASNGSLAIAASTHSVSSVDGINWQPMPPGFEYLSAVVSADDRFMMTDFDTRRHWTSLDGSSWTLGSEAQGNLRTDGEWFYLGHSRSKDGVSWEDFMVGVDLDYTLLSRGLIVKNGQVSPDGLQWNEFRGPIEHDLHARETTITSSGSIWVIAGESGLIASGDHPTRIIRRTKTAPFASDSHTGGAFFRLGGQGAFSYDGLEWTDLPPTSGLRESWERILYNGNQFALIQSDGRTLVGPTPSSLEEAPSLVDLREAAGAAFGYYFRLTIGGDLQRSTDGRTWSTLLSSQGWQSEQWSFVANDHLFYCTDKATYIIGSSGTVNKQTSLAKMRGIAYSGTHYGAVVGDGQVMRSSNGVSWGEVASIEAPDRPFDIAWGEGRFLVPTERGNLFETTDLLSWNQAGHIPGYRGGIFYARDRFWLTVDSRWGGWDFGTPYGRGFMTLGGPAGQPPIIEWADDAKSSVTQPVYSRLDLFPIITDPEGNLIDVSVSGDGPSSWLSELPGNGYSYEPNAPGKHTVTVTARDQDGNEETKSVQVDTRSTEPRVELPAGYLGRMNASVYFKGAWWAFGIDGRAARSENGTDWQPFALPDAINVLEAQAIGSRILALTESNRLVSSEDGLAWQEVRAAVPGADPFHPKLFKAGSQIFYREGTGTTVTSRNGEDWESVSGLEGVFSVVSENGFYGAEDDRERFYASSDGVRFSELPSLFPNSFSSVASLATGNGLFVMVADSRHVYTSTQPNLKWTRTFTLPAGPGQLIFGGGRFYLSSTPLGTPSPVYASVDGANWAASSFFPERGVLVAGERLVAPGFGHRITSTDGLSWSSDPSKPGVPVGYAITPGNEGFLAMRMASSANIWRDGGQTLYSTDGIDWPEIDFQEPRVGPRISEIGRQADRRFLREAGGNPAVSRVRVSTGLGRWTDLKVEGKMATAFAIGGGFVLVVTADRTVYRSVDGQTWTLAGLLPDSVDPQSAWMAKEGGRFFVPTANNTLLHSESGAVWSETVLPGGTDEKIAGASFGAGRWILTKGQRVCVSSDLINWTWTNQMGTGPARFIGDRFYLPVKGGCRTSADGLDWSFSVVSEGTDYYRVARVHDRIVLFRTSPDSPDGQSTLGGGYYDDLETGRESFSGSPYITDAFEVGQATYLVGRVGTLMRIPHLDLRVDRISTNAPALLPGATYGASISITNPTHLDVPAGHEARVEVLFNPKDAADYVNAILLGEADVGIAGGMAAGETISINLDIRLPDLLEPGTYRLAAILKTDLDEANRFNNTLIKPATRQVYPSRTLSTHIDGPGSLLDMEPGTLEVAEGSRVHLVPVPNEGAYFRKWLGDIDGGVGAVSVVMEGDREVTAEFAAYRKLAIAINGNGSVRADPDPLTLIDGTVAAVEAVPAPGWVFTGWTGCLHSATSLETIPVNADLAVTASFDRSYDGFLDFWFTASERNDSGISGPLADPDGDGLVNAVEFVFDLDPRNGGRRPAVEVRHGSIVYPRNRFLDGWSLRVATSTDLINWTTVGLNESIISSDNSFDYVETRRNAVSTEPMFFRIEVLSPAESLSALSPDGNDL